MQTKCAILYLSLLLLLAFAGCFKRLRITFTYYNGIYQGTKATLGRWSNANTYDKISLLTMYVGSYWVRDNHLYKSLFISLVLVSWQLEFLVSYKSN